MQPATDATVFIVDDDAGVRDALAWLLRQPDIVIIPKASSEAHVRDNHAALELTLTAADLAEIDAAFPPPKRATPLAMI